MKERPILFSAPMVRALLNGSKTQTRRVFKAKNGGLWPNINDIPGMRQILRNCPYGQPSDRLWVRETWSKAGGDSGYWYRATDEHADDGESPVSCWKPSIHMPRAASRITLEIVSVRVERLQDISEADALAEGVTNDGQVGGIYVANNPRGAYVNLWGQINGPESWDANPWVWAIEFKRVSQ